jgi:single-stranded-DNA-specific exonuclease
MQIQRRQIASEVPGLGQGLPKILQRIYHSRGIRSAQEIDHALTALLPPGQLGGIPEAMGILHGTMQQQGNILVVGDFDADGATSCALAVLALRAMGYQQVDFLVPNRFNYGYGLTPEIVELALAKQPQLIITVDNGISSLAGVAAARKAGVQVIVTDHHLAGNQLPEANAIVNPNAPGNHFPSKAVAGVGVIFYVLLALRAYLRGQGWFKQINIPEPNMANYLDLVALGTVADVVPLDQNNRIMVSQGLQRIRSAQCRPGILALLEVAGRDYRRTQANDIGFAVGPRLNAAGRLDDMSLGIECLLTDDANTAREYAQQLDSLNRERRSIEQNMQVQAETILESWQEETKELAWGLCLYQADWHQGVIGILASRIKDRYHRPVIAFAHDKDGMLKGSARSIKGLHIRDALDSIAAQHPDLLAKFGGHAMAAGMLIREADFEQFCQVFDNTVRHLLTPEDLRQHMLSDGAIQPTEMNLAIAQQIRDAGPWGQGFVEPLFDDVFNVLSQRIVGEKHWKLVLRHQSGQPTVDAIAFNSVADFPELPPSIHVAYRLDINEWQGQVNLQLIVEHIEEALSC